ncbi:polymorphic toxin-type HINT domain-containing protein [Sphaerisporangium fuscum]|uniref:polymorphic toxin-type HINT domain-containing protein n=1 Tax=Sphaerisporangium fuscum TaxID=2835868 RepID=UPI001BDD2FFC|nr:polymorphic toxin-type HINT domain-containing protein [Sphaerisporangium fuscum]
MRSGKGLNMLRRSPRLAATVTALVVCAGLLAAAPVEAPPVAAETTRLLPKPADPDKTVAGHEIKVKPRKLDDSVTHPAPPPEVTWPKAGVAEVSLPAAAPGLRAPAARAAATKAGDLPLWVGAAPPAGSASTPGVPPSPGAVAAPAAGTPPSKVRVRMLDRAAGRRAGVDGPVFSVEPSGAVPQKVAVRLDYSGFARAYGASYGSRLRLVRLPACALTTPDAPACRTATPVASANDGEHRTVSAEVAMTGAATVLAAASAPSSDKGDYKATSLSASATWGVGPQSGDFTWSYPMRVPPVPGGLTPNLDLSYSSSSIDGRTSNTNTQPSWVGDGFDLWPGYIERRYKSCKDDGVPKNTEWDTYPGDLCWGYDNATMTLNGKGGELIPVGDGKWRMKNDDGTRIEKLTGESTGNGDNDGEYWKVTTTDGTQYFFGLNTLKLENPETQSTWTVPVFGDDDGEPCHKSEFKDSWCQQAWRWNLDKVVDRDGNAITYFYKREWNHYGRDLKSEDETSYVRGGYLDHVDYGLRADNLFPGKAPARVEFEVSERCIRDTDADCAEDKIKDHPEYWEDVPWDLHCDSGQECKEEHGTLSPTFWSRKRLTLVKTEILKADGTDYRPVDYWELGHAWGMADVDRQLLLTSIVHTGLAGPDPVVLPPVSFVYTQMPNRVDKLGDDLGPFVKDRLGTVYNEFGGVLDIKYSGADCTTGDLPTPQTDRRRCFPTYWSKTSGESDDPTLDWFHKYVVTETVQTDLTGGSPDMVTRYDYTIGHPAWHFDDDDGLTPEKYKTWSQWRGYDKVRVISAATSSAPGQVDHWYFQGMDGDRLNTSGGKKDVEVSDGEGGSYPDHDSLQGFEVRTVTYDKAGGKVVSKSVASPWHQQTASRTRSWGTVTANLVGTKTTRKLTALDDGSWRETKTTTDAFDTTTGAPTQVDDFGDTSTDADDRCTTTTMAAQNTTDWLVGLPAQVRTVAASCDKTVDLTKQLISDGRTYYDGGAFGAAPTRGLATATDKVAATGTTSTAVRYVPATRTAYDAYGRPKTVTVVDNTGTTPVERTTTTAYTETSGLTTRTTVTGPPVRSGDPDSAMTTTTELDPAWGSTLKSTDEGDRTTVFGYDALGRMTRVWAPGRGTDQLPDKQFGYQIVSGRITAVSTKELNDDGGQDTAYELIDGWLRTRQTQQPGPDGGRLIADTFYNAQGGVDRTYAAYYADGAPSTSLFGVDTPGQVETQTAYTYDGLGRVVAERLLAGNSDAGEKWRTTYAYGGDRTTVTPPDGGITTTTLVDALGRQVEVRRHKPGGYDSTFYSYTPRGQLASIKGFGGHTWTYDYDLRGRQIQTSDPDKGVAKFGYDDLDRLVQTEDARGKKIGTTYDPIGRKTARYDITSGSPGVKLEEWTYDTVRKGQPASSIRYENGATYTEAVNFYDPQNRPTRTTITLSGLPAAESALAPSGGYQFNTVYNLDGSVQSVSSPAAGGLPAEVIATTYDGLGRAVKLTSNLGSYVIGTDYSKTSKLLGRRLSTGGKQVDQTFGYEFGTQRLKTSMTVHVGMPGVDRAATYGYDDAGDVTQITDVSRDGTDNQCFRYDHLQRLTDAWTQAADGCAADPATATLGGPAPYRTAYTFDASGNRATETQYDTANKVASTRTYAYAGGSGVGASYKGHQLATVTTQTGAGGRTDSYAYDATGNTTRRTTGAGDQTLAWDVEGHLAKVTDSGTGETSYGYDSDGDRLIRRDPAGTTLYLPGLELRLNKGATATQATRYYSHDGETIAMRTAAGVTFISPDHQGTGEVAIDATTGGLSKRRYTPFGQPRGTASGVWPGERGFVGGTIDSSTSLTHLGAREYDANIGRFISVDPLFNMDFPQSWDGYSYANQTPVTQSDPDGLDGPLRGNPNCYYANVGCPKSGGGGKSEGRGSGNGGSPPARRCHFWCHVGNFTGGAASGFVNGTLGTAKNFLADVFYSTVKMSCPPGIPTGCVAAADDAQANSPLYRDIPTWGDKNSKMYKAGKFAGEWGPVIIGGVEAAEVIALKLAEKAAAKGAPRLLDKAATSAARRAGRARSAPEAEAGSAGKPCNSFVPGTQVLMADGGYKPIERVKIGDLVAATDPRTGGTEAEPVTALITGAGTKHLVQVTVDADGDRGNASGSVTATDGHPFWVDDLREWRTADQLQPDMWLRTSAGTHVQITAVKKWTAIDRVHNLTVDDVHTYYVRAGATTLLTHNCPSEGGAAPKGAPAPTQRVYGPFHRIETDSQPVEAARMQVESQEMWGRTPAGGLAPTVQAYHGPLPEGARGIEFYTTVRPYAFNGPDVRWYEGMPGVRSDDEFAKISCIITANTQC